MKVLKKVLGPLSKYDQSIPYTYMAKVTMIGGFDDLYSYYFADTICGLIEYLDKHNILPQDVELFGIYRKKEVPLEKELALQRMNTGWTGQKFVIHWKIILRKH